MTAKECILGRRSIRKFKSDAVDHELLKQIKPREVRRQGKRLRKLRMKGKHLHRFHTFRRLLQ